MLEANSGARAEVHQNVLRQAFFRGQCTISCAYPTQSLRDTPTPLSETLRQFWQPLSSLKPCLVTEKSPVHRRVTLVWRRTFSIFFPLIAIEKH
jgi:hypothetical protein